MDRVAWSRTLKFSCRLQNGVLVELSRRCSIFSSLKSNDLRGGMLSYNFVNNYFKLLYTAIGLREFCTDNMGITRFRLANMSLAGNSMMNVCF